MPNHVHLLIRIRDENELDAHFCLVKKKPMIAEGGLDYPVFVMQQFSNLFTSYAKAYNLRFNRRGALFIDYVRRKPVENEVVPKGEDWEFGSF